MKRVVLVAAGFALVVPDLALAQQAQPQHRPPQHRPPTTKPAPGFERPVRPGHPGVRPPMTKPAPGYERPVRPGRPIVRPPHRPGFRPPNFRPLPGPVFRYPRGWGYRRWVAGALLPSLFLGATYAYGNYGALGFGPPPAGYRWVRYGPDLLLVNVRTRRIVDVVRGAFR